MSAEGPGLAAPEHRYPETRIGPFDFSEATGTDVIDYASGSSHRASIDSCCELAADLGLYSQPDPIGLQGGLNLFGYALGNPVSLTDEDGTTPSSVVEEATCFFCTLLAEAGGTSRPCQRAVASVILNRLSDAKQDDPMASICDVVSKPGAFSGYGNSTYRSCTNCSAPLPGLPALFANLGPQ